MFGVVLIQEDTYSPRFSHKVLVVVLYVQEKRVRLPRVEGFDVKSDIVTETYDLEYGSATLELQKSSQKDEVVIVDDVLATGGTMMAANKLANKAGYEVVGNIVLVDLKICSQEVQVDSYDLNVKSVITYE